MNSKLKRGCGIGCALLFVVSMILFGSTAYFAKQMGKQYKVVEGLEAELRMAHGVSSKLPAGDTGLPAAERLEVFLTVREATAEWRLNVENSFEKLLAGEGNEQAKGLRHFLRLVKASRDLAPVFSGFWTARNQALLDGQMGMGEYIYLYCLSYNSWLGLDPSDGARDAESFLSGLGATGPMVKQGEGNEDDFKNEAKRREWAHQQVNRLMLPLLQQAAHESTTGDDPEQVAWAQTLQQEVAALQDDPLRIPFAGNPPPAVAAALEPFRVRLEATYSVTVNPVELLFEDTWEDKP